MIEVKSEECIKYVAMMVFAILFGLLELRIINMSAVI